MQRIMRRITKMKSKNIRSLKKLRQRKEQILTKLAKCEEQITDDYLALTQPISSLIHSTHDAECNEDLPFAGVHKLVLNSKRVVDILKLGISVYNDYRK